METTIAESGLGTWLPWALDALIDGEGSDVRGADDTDGVDMATVGAEATIFGLFPLPLLDSWSSTSSTTTS